MGEKLVRRGGRGVVVIVFIEYDCISIVWRGVMDLGRVGIGKIKAVLEVVWRSRFGVV